MSKARCTPLSASMAALLRSIWQASKGDLSARRLSRTQRGAHADTLAHGGAVAQHLAGGRGRLERPASIRVEDAARRKSRHACAARSVHGASLACWPAGVRRPARIDLVEEEGQRRREVAGEDEEHDDGHGVLVRVVGVADRPDLPARLAFFRGRCVARAGAARAGRLRTNRQNRTTATARRRQRTAAAAAAAKPAGRCLVQIGAPDALVGGVEGGVEEHAGDGLDHAREERAHLQQPDLAGLPPPRLTAGNGPERPAGGRGTSARAAPGRNGLPLPGSTALHACAALWQGGNWAFLAPCRKDGRTGWAPALHGLLDAGRNAVAFEANHWRGAL